MTQILYDKFNKYALNRFAKPNLSQKDIMYDSIVLLRREAKIDGQSYIIFIKLPKVKKNWIIQ